MLPSRLVLPASVVILVMVDMERWMTPNVTRPALATLPLSVEVNGGTRCTALLIVSQSHPRILLKGSSRPACGIAGRLNAWLERLA